MLKRLWNYILQGLGAGSSRSSGAHCGKTSAWYDHRAIQLWYFMNCKPLEEAGPGQEKVNFSLSSLRVRRWRRSSWVHFSIQLEPVVSPSQRFCFFLANKIYCGLALVKIGWTRTEPKSCFPMSLTSSSSTSERGKYAGIWRQSINFFRGCSHCHCIAIYRQELLFVCSMNIILPYLFWSREHNDDVRDIEKQDFRSVVLHPVLPKTSAS